MAPHLSPTDSDALTGDLAAYFHGNMLHALGDGADGWIDDDLAFAKPWGFELAAIARPVLWSRAATTDGPPAHGGGSPSSARAPRRGSTTRTAISRSSSISSPEVHEWLLSHS